MRTGFALMLIMGGLLLVYSAFQTPPDPRIVLGNILSGRAPGTGFTGSPTVPPVGGSGGGGGAW